MAGEFPLGTEGGESGANRFLVDIGEQGEEILLVVDEKGCGVWLEETAPTSGPFVERFRIGAQKPSNSNAADLGFLFRTQQEMEVGRHQTVRVQREGREKEVTRAGKEVRAVLGGGEDWFPVVGAVEDVVIFSLFKEHGETV